MLNKLKSLFKKSKQNVASQTQAIKEIIEKPIISYFQEELNSSKYIKKEHHETVLKHLTHEINLIKTENKLTSDEKKALGLNPRQTITRELIEILTEDGFKLQNPKEILAEIYNKATIAKSTDDKFAKSIKLGIETFTLNAPGDESECEWCKAHLDVEMGQNILQLMNENCTCTPYSKCFINPVIKF